MLQKKFEIENKNNLIDEKIQINCENEPIYCINNQMCSSVCNSILYTCEDTINQCVPISITNENPTQECDTDHGFLWVINNNEILGNRWECISSKPNLYNEERKLMTHVCNEGSFNFPTDCQCGSNKELVYRDGDIDTPRCAANIKIFPSFHNK